MASDIRGLECAEGGKVIFRKWFEKEFLCRKFMVWRIVIRQEKDTHSLKANRNRQMHVLPSANRLCEVQCNILLWWRIFLLSKVYRRILKVIKHILFVSKTARLVPCFTIFTGEKNRRYRVTLEKKSPLNYTRRLTSSLGPSLHLHRETSAMQVVE